MAETLPPVSWTRRADLARMIEVLGRANCRWVGGAVRDTLIGATVADVDCATKLLPRDVMQKLKEAGIRTVPTGIDHGTITALLDQGPVEITTLRHDVSTDGRRATVSFAREWQEDAARRDFTINALYADPVSREISDYFGGLDDLKERKVRFIGDARQRIREDHLRILRYFRFQCRFGAELDPEAEDACAELAPMLKGLSRERIAMELSNLLALPDPHGTVARMFEMGVLPVILPECGTGELARLGALVAEEEAQSVTPDPIRRLAALLPSDPRIAGQVAARLRLSSAQKKRLVHAAEKTSGELDARALAYRLGMDQAVDRLLLARQSIAPLADWEIPQLPIKGGEIVERGVAAGPEVARLLQAVENAWIKEGFPDRTRVEEILNSQLPK
jgi:poly(A) polymerase